MSIFLFFYFYDIFGRYSLGLSVKIYVDYVVDYGDVIHVTRVIDSTFGSELQGRRQAKQAQAHPSVTSPLQLPLSAPSLVDHVRVAKETPPPPRRPAAPLRSTPSLLPQAQASKHGFLDDDDDERIEQFGGGTSARRRIGEYD